DFKSFRVNQLLRGKRFKDYDSLRRNFFFAALFQLAAHSFEGYDVVLSSAAHLARYIRKGTAKHFSYTHYPFRMLYEPNQYPQIQGISRGVVYAALPLLRMWDRFQAHRIDRFVANSRVTQRAIQRYYKRDSDIIFAPVLGAPEDYQPVPKENFFLLVSRLEPWKRLESTMDAFRKLNERLIIIGDGPHRETLQRRAAKNIKFV